MSITIQVAIVDTLSAMSVTDWMPTRSASGLMVGTEAFATVYTLFNISQANCLTTVCTRLSISLTDQFATVVTFQKMLQTEHVFALRTSI